MARFEPDEDARRLGEALSDLRRAAGLSQAEAGAQAGLTSQGWGLYESGRRASLFRPDVQGRLTRALGASPEALALAVARRSAAAPASGPAPAGSGLEAGGRTWRGAPDAPASRMGLDHDRLTPWAAAGATLTWRPGQAPEAGQGVVVMTGAETVVGLCAGLHDDSITVIIDLASGRTATRALCGAVWGAVVAREPAARR